MRIRTGVKALIVHEGKVLVMRERVARGTETIIIHDFPGGGIEGSETLHEALHREIKEEVGLKISIGSIVGAWEFFLEDKENKNAEGVHIVCIGYQCKLIGSTQIDLSHNPAQGEDIFETQWFTPQELIDQPKIIGDEAMLEAVKNLRL